MNTTPAARYAAELQRLQDAGPFASLGYGYYADKPGRKYTRVVLDSGNQRHVHAFVENATGAVFKAATWAAPAKGARHASVEDALAAMGERVSTGHLYR